MIKAPIELLSGTAQSSIIFLHGLGADGTDLLPVAQALQLTGVRFILPHAPSRAVTINHGYVMPAWYDIRSAEITVDQDDAGFTQARTVVADLIQHEITRGIPANRIVLAGFSQGGAVALYSGLTLGITLAGIAGLSTYLPRLTPTTNIPPLWIAHGVHDEVIPLMTSQSSFNRLPTALAHSHLYPIGHEISLDEIADLRTWLLTRLPSAAS